MTQTTLTKNHFRFSTVALAAVVLYANNMKIARTYSLLPEAQVAVSLLSSRGIDAYIMDDNLASISPGVTSAAGIRVGVAEGDYSEAIKILDYLATGSIEEPSE